MATAMRHTLRNVRDLVRPVRRMSYSQFAEDLVAMDLLRWIRRSDAPGTYVDVGANHPKRYSNTYALYRAGWRGITVDVDPDNCRQLSFARPGDRVVCAALGERPERRTLYRFAISEMNTLDPEWAKRFVSEGQVLREEVQVDVRRLDEVLDAHPDVASRGIDLLAIDAEGFDLPILRGLDLSRHRPTLVLLEVAESIDLPEGGACELLRDAGYAMRARLFNSAIWQDRRSAA